MALGDWIALAGLVLVVAGALTGALWALLQGQIHNAHNSASGAHRRLDGVQGELSTVRLHLAENYVKNERLSEELEKVVGRRMDAFDARLDRQDRLLERIASRLHVPPVGEEG